MSWKKFWEWNKKVMADDRPVLAFAEQKDDEGKKEGFVWLMGSFFYYNDKPKKEMNMPLMISQLNTMRNMPHPWDRKKLSHKTQLIELDESDEGDD